MKTSPAAPSVYSPCAKKWEFMHAAGLRRQFCDRCQLPVHNLSALSKHEAEAFLERSKTRRTCITYALRPNGTMVTRTWREVWGWQRVRLRERVLATARMVILMKCFRNAPLSRLDVRR